MLDYKNILLRFTVLILIVCSFLATSVFAHPGRTDSKGGHVDRSTGQYHYHHGYPAHDHTDMDGDGSPDCPYKFVDKTSHKDSNSATPPTVKSSPYIQENTDTAEFSPILRIFVIIPFFLSVFCICSFEVYFCLEAQMKHRLWMKLLFSAALLLTMVSFPVGTAIVALYIWARNKASHK